MSLGRMLRQKKILLLLEVLLIAGLGFWVYHTLTANRATHPGEVEVTIQIPKAHDRVGLWQDPAGKWHCRVTLDSGQQADWTPDELAANIHRDRNSRSFGQKLLNISSPGEYVWVGLGFLGQVLFTGRMVVQLFVSERNKKSTVPPMFWWMSLAGSSMLMVYFLWRQDPVGLLGQSFGWFIYIRNLWLIYRPQAPHADAISVAESEEGAPEGVVTASAQTPRG